MPVTTNYGWTMPTEGGDSGTWDTILNTMFQAIDTTVKSVENKTDQQYGVAYIPGNAGADGLNFFSSSNPEGAAIHMGGGLVTPLVIPIRVRPGHRITGWAVRGKDANLLSVARLGYRDNAGGAFVQVGTDKTLASASHTTYSESGLTHDVLADRIFYIKVTPSVGASALAVDWVSVTTIDTP